jgi:hypothetical protein
MNKISEPNINHEIQQMGQAWMRTASYWNRCVRDLHPAALTAGLFRAETSTPAQTSRTWTFKTELAAQQKDLLFSETRMIASILNDLGQGSDSCRSTACYFGTDFNLLDMDTSHYISMQVTARE